jgi:hypothetical protein
VPKSLRSAAVCGQPGQFHPWLAKEAVDAQKSQRKQTLKTRMVAAPGLFELNQIKLLGCQTAAQSNFDLQRFSGVVSNRAPSLTLQRIKRLDALRLWRPA